MSYKLSIVKNKMMKRIINILILLCCIASLSSCGNSTEERSRVLKIYNWADYIDEDVLAEFPDWYKQQTGEDLRIIYQVFDINEIMLTKIERGHEDFDVVCPSEYIIERMLRKDLLLPIDRNFGHTPDYIPNVSPYIRHELNKTSQPERQTEDYAVPYMWGTAGILFNKKFITAEVGFPAGDVGFHLLEALLGQGDGLRGVVVHQLLYGDGAVGQLPGVGVDDGGTVGIAVAVLHQYFAAVFGVPEDVPCVGLFGSKR